MSSTTTPVSETRKRLILELIGQVRSIAGEGIDRVRLDQIAGALQELATHRELFSSQEFPAAADGSGVVLYRLHCEPDESISLYLNVIDAGKSSKPHNHTTWAAIAALRGQELNRIYERIDDGSVPGRAELRVMREFTVEPGAHLSFMPDDIHSIHGVGGDGIRHLHLYGRALERLDERLGFDLETGQVVPYNNKYMTPSIVVVS